jgi:hypothetical protein
MEIDCRLRDKGGSMNFPGKWHVTELQDAIKKGRQIGEREGPHIRYSQPVRSR